MPMPELSATAAALDVWGELVAAYEGQNGFGGHTAEIYAFRLLPPGPRYPYATLSEADQARIAAENLTQILRRFQKLYSCEIGLAGCSDKGTRVLDLDRETVPPFLYRTHVSVRPTYDGRPGDRDVPSDLAGVLVALISEARNTLVPARHDLQRAIAHAEAVSRGYFDDPSKRRDSLERLQQVQIALQRLLDYATACAARADQLLAPSAPETTSEPARSDARGPDPDRDIVPHMFNGTPVIIQISSTELRVTGITLNANTSTTIGFSVAGGAHPAPDLRLPDTFPVPATSFLGSPVPLEALVQVEINPNTVGPFTNLPPSIEKAGNTGEDFRIKITNTKTDETTQGLEIYLTLLAQTRATPSVFVNVQDPPNTTIEILAP